MDPQWLREKLIRPAVLGVVGFTIVLTSAFVGLAALVSGDAIYTIERVPFYVLATAIAFMLSLWRLDDRARDGLTVLIAAAGMGVSAGTLVGLAGEGAAHAWLDPWAIVDQNLVVYFLAAAIICTGLGVWGLRHWREFTRVQLVR